MRKEIIISALGTRDLTALMGFLMAVLDFYLTVILPLHAYCMCII